MFRRQHLLVSLSVALIMSILVIGCKEDTQATPRVTFESRIALGTHSPTECTQKGTWFTIGSFGNPGLGRENPDDPASPLKEPVRPIDDGAQDQQGTASVSCSVVEAGDGFDVALSAQLTGATGGSVIVTGRVLRNVNSPNITAALTRKGETYAGKTCNITFDPAQGHAVAGGRIWALLDCPDAEAPSQQRICATNAQLRFENCAQ